MALQELQTEVVENTFLTNYISDIPWHEYSSNEYNNNKTRYLENFTKHLAVKNPVIPLINYFDDKWDFNDYMAYKNRRENIVSFVHAPSEIKTALKFFVIDGMTKGLKPSTLNNKVMDVIGIVSEFIKEGKLSCVDLMTTDDIIEIILNKGNSSSTNRISFCSAADYFSFTQKRYKKYMTINIDILREYSRQCEREAALLKEENKYQDIPEEYFITIRNMAVKVMRDDTQPYNFRMTACGIVILSQLGLRIGEVLNLKTTDLFTIHLPKSGLEANYIRYRTFKPSHINTPVKECNIFCTPLCYEAFTIAVNIRNNCQFSQNNDYLIIFDEEGPSNNKVPFSRERFNYLYDRFFIIYLYDECHREWDNIEPTVYKKKDTVYIPATPQYRVHVCTELYYRCVPAIYIMKFYGHLEESMKLYYARPKDTRQENAAYTENVLKNILQRNVRPLSMFGPQYSKNLIDNVKAFLEKKNIVIYNDSQEIMKALDPVINIRGKRGGVCIKTSLLPCSIDAKSDELNCAANLCPNIFFFFYNIADSYMDFQTLKQTYERAVDNKNFIAAETQLKLIKRLTQTRIIPELEELEIELAEKGIDNVINDFPYLAEIINSRNEIRKEILLWSKKNVTRG